MYLRDLSCPEQVNNAGTNVRNSIENASREEYHSIVGINMDACYFMCKETLPLLKRSSRPTITMVSSGAVLGRVSFPSFCCR